MIISGTMLLILAFVLGTFFSVLCLYWATKWNKIKVSFTIMLAISVICNLLAFIPYIGWLTSIVAMVILLAKWTDAKFWPDAVWIATIANILPFVLMFFSGIISSARYN